MVIAVFMKENTVTASVGGVTNSSAVSVLKYHFGLKCYAHKLLFSLIANGLLNEIRFIFSFWIVAVESDLKV